MLRIILSIAFLLFSLCAGAQFQGLIVNEFSQGRTGSSEEYIELLVVGNRTCTDSTADLRGWIIDDQNGWYGTANASPGHYRFRDLPNWAAVPFGSIILIYNGADKNPSIAIADDATDANNDLTYVVPISNTNTYFEQNTSQPSNPTTLSYSYPVPSTSTGYSATTNQWQFIIGLNNSNGDVISLISPSDRSSAAFSIGYGFIIGGGFQNPSVSIPNVGSNSGAFLNSDNYIAPGSWVISPVPAAETPGLPNGGANSTWIMNMRLSRPQIDVSSTAAPVCYSNMAQSTTLSINYAVQSTTYNISWDASPANNFAVVTNAALPAGAVPIAIPAATPAGTYTGYLAVQNASGNSCSTDTFTVTVFPSPATPVLNLIHPTCTNPGSIEVSAPGGPGLLYSLDGVNYQGNPLFPNLTAGSYTVSVKDANGCIVSANVIINPVPAPPPAPAVSVQQPTCGANTGSLSVTSPTGAGFTYSIDGTNFQSATNFSGLAPGGYTVTVRNSGNCISGTNVIINPAPAVPPAPTLTVTQPTCAAATGSITIESPLGSGYVYSINGSSFTAVTQYSGLSPNNYTVTVRNIDGCTSSATITIQPPPALPPAPVVIITQPDCATATGSIQVSPPIAGYSYSIDGLNYSNTSGFFPGLAASTYFITAKNNDGCVSTSTQVIINPQPITPIVQVNSPAICPGATATIAVTVSPAGSYTYAWTVPAGATNPGNVASFTSAVAGSYSVMVTHANGCSATATGNLTVNSTATVTADNKQVCAGGTVALTGQPAGGVWSGTGVSGSQFDATGLPGGNYTVTYTFSSGSCSGSADAMITVAPVPAVPIISVSNQCNGTSTLVATNYSGSLVWSTGAATPSITVSVAGNYTVTQTLNGCTSVAAVAFANPLAAPATPIIVSLQQPDCSNRTGSFTVTSAGTGITYTIDALSMVSTTGLFTNLSPGTYAVTARSSDGCVSPAMFINILPPPPVPPAPTVQVAQPDCSGNRGAIGVLTPVGAGLQYSINGTTYQSSPLFSNLAPGNYSASVRNSAGCISPVVPVQILAPGGTVSSSMTACIAEGGSYNFNNQLLTTTGNYSTTYVRPNSCDSVVNLYLLVAKTEVQNLAGCGRVVHNGNTYLSSVTLRDTMASVFANCDSLYRVTRITVSPEPVSTVNVCLPAGQTYNFNGQILTSSGRYTGVYPTSSGCDSTVHLLLTVASQQTQNLSACGEIRLNGVTYTRDTTVSITIPSLSTGCDSIIRVTNLVITPKPSLVVSSGKTICKGESVQLRATAGSATVAWQGFGAGNEITVTPAVTTTFTAIAIAAPGCSTTADVTIRVDDLDLQLVVTPNPVIAGQTITVKSSASSSYQVLRWSPAFSNSAATQQLFVADSSMFVQVWARSPGGCLDSASVQIVVDPLGDVYIPNAFTPNGDGKNDLFVIAGGSFKAFGLKIFNRWGEMIFYSPERNKGWDGRAAGKEQPMGTYVYVLTGILKDGRAVERKGTVTLIR